MKHVLAEALQGAKEVLDQGKLANYIPELTKANPQHLGVAVNRRDGEMVKVGDYDVSFTIQSISKVVTLLIALKLFGYEKVFSIVGMEPSGMPFSEFISLSDFSDKPKNPFINAGAIALTSLIASSITEEEYLEYLGKIFGRTGVNVDLDVYNSEMNHAERNHSLAWELKRMKLLSSDLDYTLDFYTKMCAVEVTAEDLAKLGRCLALYGHVEDEQFFNEKDVAACLSLMFTCGLYDGSGDFAVEAGLPAKSGVGGGILAVIPGKAGIATFGPALDHNGNSIGGVALLKEVSRALGLHCFKPFVE